METKALAVRTSTPCAIPTSPVPLPPAATRAAVPITKPLPPPARWSVGIPLPLAAVGAALGAAALLFVQYTALDEGLRRVAASHRLLAALKAAGAEHVALDVHITADGGVGVFLAEPVTSGAALITLPSSLMLSVGTPSAPAQASLPLALAKERRNISRSIMSHYLATLPLACPANLAVRSDADLALAALSLHAWKVDLLARERQRMSESAGHEVLPFSSDEVAWATCMKLSRAYAGVGHGPVMMPFVDLVNHGFGRSSTCVERGSWVDEASGAWQASLVARRDLSAGEELTYEYHQTPSRARMLSSFGFATDNMPSASLAANGLPERDPQWLALHGCVPPLRTDLFLQVRPPARLRPSHPALGRGLRWHRISRHRISPSAM